MLYPFNGYSMDRAEMDQILDGKKFGGSFLLSTSTSTNFTTLLRGFTGGVP